MKRIGVIILGGGQGSRLFPLTMNCCKPAAAVGGRFRLIDIPISNAINSGCGKIFILTQFLSTSLHQHIHRTYQIGTFSPYTIEILTAEQKSTHQEWFQGTADAVRKSLDYFLKAPVDYFLILSGDQLYSMDFLSLTQFAYDTNADAVISALFIGEEEAKRMGVLKINSNNFITAFTEKPQTFEALECMRLPEHSLKDKKKEFLGSMGIYLFKKEVLFSLLQEDLRHDFGSHLIPTLVKKGRVAAYLFDGYWEDVGTIASYYAANMALTSHAPPLNCYDELKPIYAQATHLPPARINNTSTHESIICEGSIVDAKEIKKSIIGPRSTIGSETIIHNSYILGNDHYLASSQDEPSQHLSIGKNCVLNRVIVDRNASIGNRVQLTNREQKSNFDGEHFCIRDGIIVVMHGAHIPDGYSM